MHTWLHIGGKDQHGLQYLLLRLLLLIFMPSLGVIIVNNWLCLSVCLSVTLLQIAFLFLDGIEPFLAVISPCAPLQTFFFEVWFRPPNTQNLLPEIWTKSPVSRLVWQIDRRCLGLPGGFLGGRFNGTLQNVVEPTLVAMTVKFGLGVEM